MAVPTMPPRAGPVPAGSPMRGLVDGLDSPRPIGADLPSLFQEDELCQRLTSAFDLALAPVFSTLDCFDSYLNPRMAPGDFVDWLASWVGVDIDETWTLERRRQLVEDAVALYRVRGTAVGLAAHIRLYTGATPEIDESGGCGWSESADSAFPGSSDPHVIVRLQVPDPSTINATTVNRIVADARPAHLPYGVEIRPREGELLPGGVSVELDGLSVPPTEGAATAGRAPGDGAGPVDLPGSERVELAAPAPQSEQVSDEIPGVDQEPPDDDRGSPA
ncbi:MAG: phage tail protein [Actinomycetota bacterium]|nr:phage tail protein [Actinomycetota bacterium]